MTFRYVRLSQSESAYGSAQASGLQSYRVIENAHVYVPSERPIRTIESAVQVQRKERVADMSRGNIRMHPVIDKKFARWFAMAFGKETYSTENTTVGRHTFEPKRNITDSDIYKSFTMHKGIDIDERRYTGFGVERLTWSQRQQELAELNVSTFSKKVGGTNSLASLSDFSTQAYLSTSHITTMTLGGSAVKFEDFSIDVDGPASPAHVANALDISRIDLKECSVKFNANLRYLTDDQLDAFRDRTAQAIVIKYDNGVEIPSSSPGTNYSLTFNLYRLRLEDADVKISQQNRAVQIIGGECEENDDGDLCKVTIDDETTAAYV